MKYALALFLVLFASATMADERYPSASIAPIAHTQLHARHISRHHKSKPMRVVRHEHRRQAPRHEAHQRPFVEPVGPAIKAAAANVANKVNILVDYAKSLIHAGNAPTDKLPIPLQNKLTEIQQSCDGFKVISTVCGHNGHSLNIAGTHRMSLHCSNQAADFQVRDYSCAYAHLLHNWTGGLSGDPGAVGHIHLSYGGHEGHFCHGGHGGAHCMFASNHRQHIVHRQHNKHYASLHR
jgi:hypothetical protein